MGIEAKKKKVLTTEKLVEFLLEQNENLRDNDNALIVRVYGFELAKRGLDVRDLSFAYIVNNIKALGLPTMESITRLRRKVQTDRPDLMASEKIARYRDENEEVFREVMSE